MDVVESVKNVLLVTSCITTLFVVVVFWYLVIVSVFDGIVGVKPTDKEIADKTK